MAQDRRLDSCYGCNGQPLPFVQEEASAVWNWLIAREKSGTGSSSQNKMSDFVLQFSVRSSKPFFQ